MPLPATSERTSTIDCSDMPVRAINREIRAALAGNSTKIMLLHPGARHNLGVALPEGTELTIDGPAGYYVAGLNDGATVHVHGGVGWGAAESMRDGVVTIDGDAGNAVAAAIRDGVVVVRGDASTRAGIAMKGGVLIVGGSVGPMAGFMMQKGIIIICGDAADGVADSMYAGTVYVAGKLGELGADAVVEEFTGGDRDLVYSHLERWKIPAPAAGFRKLVAGRKLWNFQKADRHLWKSAL
ncbi:glutamate synthase family protein [Singulisphaera acidiphila DSM 18658]|uniref:Glutamate synthase family protein n=2 Tax=Singulisphaera acidiphila TaxID=466153 RepID=L0D770_SINAD|nr:glutamate synthase family protein [Singulisphaera acidiphila DSM 18658]